MTGKKNARMPLMEGFWVVLIALLGHTDVAKATVTVVPGEYMSPITHGVRIEFLPSGLLSSECDRNDDGITCYATGTMIPYTLVESPPKPVHQGARIKATIEYSADWQGWVHDSISGARMPMFSFMVVATEGDEIVEVQRKGAVLSDLRRQKVVTREIRENRCYDYVFAEAARRKMTVELQATGSGHGMVKVGLEVGELFSGVSVTVHSLTMEATHGEAS